MALVPNIPTDYAQLLKTVAGGLAADPADLETCRVVASKSGKSPFDAALLLTLIRIANALEAPRA